MDVDRLCAVLDSISECTGLPMSAVDAQGEVLYDALGAGSDLLPEFRSITVLDYDLWAKGRDCPLVITFDASLFMGVLKLDADCYLITAPVGPLPKTTADLLRVCGKAFPGATAIAVAEKLQRLPTFSLRRFVRCLTLAACACTGRVYDPGDVILQNSLQDVEPELNALENKELVVSGERPHSERSFEEAVCFAIETGDEGLLNQSLACPMGGEVGHMSRNPLMQERYAFVAFATLACRAAIRGGMPQEAAFSLSDVYIQQVDRTMDVTTIATLNYKMALDYCRRVHELKLGSGMSQPVRVAVDYIAKHLHDPIRLEHLAEASGFSSRRFSEKFRAETGLTVPDYIARERLREAQYLLRYTDSSLSLIAAALQFGSQSYFTKKFKDAFGVTPQKYREGVEA